ncbi:uncharacterized protein LOC113344193 isoform X4 [Papaver somniferum]|uniref:uncharacterized protein LOC113344193 isoform X4 n=1 Tax=Papaver somniferum TaxID=3469 RepID=UPI000E6FBBD6|nr:uncharacterized protein LOC113344193 isoform X4 [Papaver somniferum]
MGTIITRPKITIFLRILGGFFYGLGEHQSLLMLARNLFVKRSRDSSKKSKDNSNKGSKSRDEISTKAKEEKDGKSRMQLLNLEE